MKRLIASAVALSVIAAPALAATATAPAKTTKQARKAGLFHAKAKPTTTVKTTAKK